MTASEIVPSVRDPWRITALVLAGTIALFGGIFWHEARDVYRVWVESTAYNHCFLVLPLVGYLIWERRAAFASAIPKPQFSALATLPLLSLAWLLATVLSIHEAQQFIVLTMLEMSLLSIVGWGVYRRLMGPLLYLYFLVPSGAFLVPALQNFTAAMVVKMLRLANVPVFSDGIFIEIPAGKFVVAEACAGLRFLIASVAFGVFFAILTYRSWRRRLVFIVLSASVPIFANALRAFGIVYAAHLLDSATAAAADHVVYGWAFFSAILILLIVIGRAFADRQPMSVSPRPSASPPNSAAPIRIALAGLLAVILASLGPTYAAVLDRQALLTATAHARPPSVVAPWHRITGDELDWTPVVYGADRSFLDAFSDGNVTIRRFVALYVARGRTNNLIRGENRVADSVNWSIATMAAAGVSVSGRQERVNVAEIASGKRTLLVVWFYALDDSIVSSALTAKVHQLRQVISAGPQVSALVAIAIDMPDLAAPPLATVSQFLDAMEPMSIYLREVSE